jgi:hypothetical protein
MMIANIEQIFSACRPFVERFSLLIQSYAALPGGKSMLPFAVKHFKDYEMK